MRLTLVCDDPQASRQDIVLDRLPAMIGRSVDVDVQLEDCSVSHYHCKIDNLGGVVVVRDLGSRLGTYVNGDGVTESVLRSGDLLTLGTARFRALYEPRADIRRRSPLTGHRARS